MTDKPDDVGKEGAIPEDVRNENAQLEKAVRRNGAINLIMHERKERKLEDMGKKGVLCKVDHMQDKKWLCTRGRP